MSPNRNAATDPPAGRAWLLAALHELAPMAGRPLLAAYPWLYAAASDAELDAAAAAHQAQADQLRNPGVRAVMRRTHAAVEPVRIKAGPRLVLLAELLALLPPELAAEITAELRGAGLDPSPWPPPGPWPA
jgi:hypothetical protein